MNKRFFVVFALIFAQILVFSINSVNAQFAPPPVKSIPLPTGSGARALGQGGAFIAVADDATAASWNPAGLIQLEKPEASIVGAFMQTDQDFSVTDTFSTGAFFLGNGLNEEDVSRWDVNFLSFAYPFRFLRKNFVAAINYHQISDFHADISFDRKIIDPSSPPLFVKQDFKFKSSGGVGALSPGIAVLLMPKLTFGMTVNIFDDEYFGSHGWTETIDSSGRGLLFGDPMTTDFKQKTSSLDYHGANITTGILWDVWEKESKLLTFGAVFHSPYTARFDQETKGSSKIAFPFQPGAGGGSPLFAQTSRVKMDQPMSIGLGLAFRHSDALSFSFDATWTDWSEWVQKTKVNTITGELIDPETGEPAGVITVNQVDFDTVNNRPLGGSEHAEIDDTYAVRFGSEYLMFREKEVIAFRGGLFYEPRPSMGAATGVNPNGSIEFDGAPTDVWGFSLGSGLTTKRFSLDAAYQFRYIRDMEGGDVGLGGTQIDAIENMFLTSLIVYF